MTAPKRHPGGEPDPGADWVCLGRITGAIGIRGELKVLPYTDSPESVAAYGPVTLFPGGERLTLKVLRAVKAGIAVRAEGITDRNAAEALRGLAFYIPRTALPELPDADEFYHDDLIGLRAEDEAGAPVGTVKAVYDFGAGDIVEIVPEDGGPSFMVAFTLAAVPVVDLKGGRIVLAARAAEDEE